MENMEKELLKLDSKELRITSVELVDIINQFREEEFNILKEKALNNELSEKLKKKLNKKDEYTKLQHYSFLAKIEKELETLEALGLNTEKNILFSEYEDTTGKKNPCYTLNRDGMLQMLNSESTIVRAKTIDYINKLEQQLNGKANLLLSIYNGDPNKKYQFYVEAEDLFKDLILRILIERSNSDPLDYITFLENVEELCDLDYYDTFFVESLIFG